MRSWHQVTGHLEDDGVGGIGSGLDLQVGVR